MDFRVEASEKHVEEMNAEEILRSNSQFLTTRNIWKKWEMQSKMFAEILEKWETHGWTGQGKYKLCNNIDIYIEHITSHHKL